MPSCPWRRRMSVRQMFQEILNRLDAIMSEQQADVDAITQQIQAEDADINTLRTQVTSGQAALYQAIATLESKVDPADLTELKAAAAVLAGDFPDLDAAVAALGADPNAAPPAPPAA